jgi:hypothetical protein
MNRTVRWIGVGLVFVLCLGVAAARAQQRPGPGSRGRLPVAAEPQAPSGTAQASSEVVPTDQSLEKARMAEWIIAREEDASGRPFDAAFLDRIRRDLATRSLEELAGVQNRASGLLPITTSLSPAQADLVYTPLTPCRIFDTRLAGGPIAGGSTRSFIVANGSGSLSFQGGSAAGCGVPFGPATAAVVNFVVVAPAGAGDLRQTPFGTPVPVASFLNYVNSGIANDNTSNGSVTTICNPATTSCGSDVTIQVDGGATDLVADVQGYFAAPVVSRTITVVASSGTITPGNFGTAVANCPAGLHAIGGGVDAGNVLTMVVTSSCPIINGNARMVVVPDGQNPAATGWAAAGVNHDTINQIIKVGAVCAPD